MNFKPGWLLRQITAASKEIEGWSDTKKQTMRVTEMTIIEELQLTIQQAQTKIKAIQDQCPHPKEAVTRKSGASTGNYDPSEDCYWADLHCKLCDKKWHVGSEDPDYRRY